MSKKITLLIDATVNLILGILLVAFNRGIAGFLGVPYAENYFYPNILGAVFIGITIALVVEAFRKKTEYTGLGLIGAVCINICGGLVLIFWLVFGNLGLPPQGGIFLWTLAILLLVISGIELIFTVKKAGSSG
jgi:hypothetical protein